MPPLDFMAQVRCAVGAMVAIDSRGLRHGPPTAIQRLARVQRQASLVVLDVFRIG